MNKDNKYLLKTKIQLMRSRLVRNEKEIDELLCDFIRDEMSMKLELSRNKGRGGWYSRDCSIEYLEKLLIEHVSKGDMIDVVNIAAMIHARGLVEDDAITLNPRNTLWAMMHWDNRHIDLEKFYYLVNRCFHE